MSGKFPRIPHLPWSPGVSRDDRKLKDCDIENFIGKEIVVTEKIDGSNLCLCKNGVFARSHSGPPTHKSFDLAKQMYAEKQHMMSDFSVFGEWCYAVHTIKYDCLRGPYPFYVFGIRDDCYGNWFDWNSTQLIADQLGFQTVPVLYDGIVEEKFQEFTESLTVGSSEFGGKKEGIVIWPASGVENDWCFSKNVAKWVRKDHVGSSEHWLYKEIEKQNIE